MQKINYIKMRKSRKDLGKEQSKSQEAFKDFAVLSRTLQKLCVRSLGTPCASIQNVNNADPPPTPYSLTEKRDSHT